MLDQFIDQIRDQ